MITSDAFAVGKRITVRIDEGMSDDLRTLAQAGWSLSDAVREALAVLSYAHVSAWDDAGYPKGSRPIVVGLTFAPYDAVATAERSV